MLSAKLRDALDNLLPDHGEDEGYLLHRGDSLRDAAVLIAFTDRPDPGVILTQRPQWLRSHAGQVAFPGGKIDPGGSKRRSTSCSIPPITNASRRIGKGRCAAIMTCIGRDGGSGA